MKSAKKYLYLFVMYCFMFPSCSFHLQAEKMAKEKPSGRERAEKKQEEASEQNQPRISFDATEYDAGEVWEGEKVSHTFTVKNTGTAQLNINSVRAG